MNYYMQLKDESIGYIVGDIMYLLYNGSASCIFNHMIINYVLYRQTRDVMIYALISYMLMDTLD